MINLRQGHSFIIAPRELIIKASLQPVTIVKAYDVPYTAGYSLNGRIIFIDRKLPQYFTTTEGVKCDVHKYIVIHEVTEKAMMLHLGMKYNDAHQIALGAEERALEEDKVSVDEYYGFVGKYIKSNLELANIKNVSPALDLTPYKEDKLWAVIERMNQIRRAK